MAWDLRKLLRWLLDSLSQGVLYFWHVLVVYLRFNVRVLHLDRLLRRLEPALRRCEAVFLGTYEAQDGRRYMYSLVGAISSDFMPPAGAYDARDLGRQAIAAAALGCFCFGLLGAHPAACRERTGRPCAVSCWWQWWWWCVGRV